MSEILCRWLNKDVKLSKYVDPNNFAECFANGYLIAELLHLNGLQDDFEMFSQSGTSEAKLSNFTRIQPTMALLEVKFNTNMAEEMINEKPGVATRLLYQLFISLGKKNKLNLTGVAMETMRPSAATRLGVIETEMYKERLKTLVPRQVDLDFDELVAKYNRKQKEQEDQARIARLKEEEEVKKLQSDIRQKGLQRSRQIREQQEETMAKIKEATVKIPKPPEKKKLGKTRQEMMKEKEMQELYSDIDNFEKSLKNMRGSIASPESSDQIRDIDADIELFLSESSNAATNQKDLVKPEANDDYILKIRQRLNEDVDARKEREKRRRRVLVEQMKVHEAQQAFIHEEMLVNRLMRQSQVERRIAVQLMNTRQQKDVVKQNRHDREVQYTERRLKDFQDALDRETELCHQAKLEYADEIRRTQELHDVIAKERALKKYDKHYEFCKEVVLDIIDFSCKFGEYRELTEKLLPPKIVREWKALFTNGKPLYQLPPSMSDEESERLSFEESKEVLLDEEDFLEYQNCVGEWKNLCEDIEVPGNNNILGFVLKRLDLILYPPTPPPAEPKYPSFPIKACVLGKCFSGKTTAIREIAETHRIESLDVESLVHFAIEAFENNEMVDIPDVLETAPIISPEDDSEQVKSADTNTDNTEDATKTQQTEQPDKVGRLSVDSENNAKEEVSDKTAEQQQQSSDDVGSTPSQSVKSGDSKDVNNEQELSIVTEPIKTFTVRAKLGEKASKYLKKGRVIPDNVLVEIIIDYVRNIPDGTGWILDGFPSNLQQAKLLEKALTGYSPLPSPQKVSQKDKKGRKAKLASDPQPPPEPKPPMSGLDVIILFDVEDGVALKRAEGRKLNPDTLEEYHEEFNPPPDGSYTGLQNKSKIKSIIDESNDKEQIQIRLIGFQDEWPKMDKWFKKFNILTKMNADLPPEEVHVNLKDLLNDTLANLAAAAEQEKCLEVEALVKAAEENAAQLAKDSAPAAEVAPPEPAEPAEPAERPQSSAKKGGKKGKDSPSPAKKGGKESPNKKGKESPKRGKESPSPAKKGKGKGKEGTPSPKGKRKKGSAGSERGRSRSREKSSNITLPDDVISEEPPKPPSPEPGSREWIYVDKPIDKEFVEILLSNWDVIEETYIAASKHAFREARKENEIIYRYFYETRKCFVEFLKRPDEKQIFVTDWQKSYNKFPEDMRSDDETKCELHQRLDDLNERLWDICDNRKEEAEKECSMIMTEGWLQDHLGILINHYISLMQMEVDRYQQTCKLMRDYYVAMEGGVGPQKLKLISEGLPQFSRIPLVELPATLPPYADDKTAEEELSNSQTVLPSSQSAKGKATPDVVEEKKPRIPLVPRRPPSAETSPSRNEKKKTAPKKESRMGTEEETSPTPSCDADEKLLHDATATALNIIEIQNNGDLADEEADLNAKLEKPAELVKTLSKEKGKGKKGDKGAKTPSKQSKINIPQPTPVLVTPELSSEEEKENQLFQEKMRKEYKRVVYTEGINLKFRVEAIKEHSILVVKKLKDKAQQTYTDMDDWLGKRFQEEMESIDKMCEVIRQAIEEERQLQDASVLEDKEFFIDDDLHIFKTPTPEPLPSPREDACPEVFTCVQLAALAKQFKEIAPDGLMSVKSFITLLVDLQSSPVGLEALPEKWMNLTSLQVENLASIIAIKNAYLNWKLFIVILSLPYPVASPADLTEALCRYRECDVASTEHITREEYCQVPIWLDEQNNIELEDTFDRIQNLKLVFFDVFSRETSEGYVLDYQDMLLYFAGSRDPLAGLMSALAIVSGEPVVDCKEDDTELANTQVFFKEKSDLWSAEIKIEDWLKVFSHGEGGHGGDHRFNLQNISAQDYSKGTLYSVYKELGFSETDSVSLNLLYSHPLMQEVIDNCTKYKQKDIQSIFDNDDELVLEQQ